MSNKTKLLESLERFVDGVLFGDEEAQKAAFHEYARDKSRSILMGESTERVDEFVGDSAIKLDGDQVTINGKPVGKVENEPSDLEAGIKYESSDGKVKGEFDTVEELYEFLADKYNVTEGRVEDAVFKQDTMKQQRAARWASVRKTKQPDGKMGEYETNDEDVYKDTHKDKHGTEEDDGMRDSRHKKGYYDADDVRKKHGDPVRGKSGEAAHADTGMMDADMKYDSHDVRKKHNS